MYTIAYILGINETIQADLQVKVTELIIQVLIANEGLHYYQVDIFVLYLNKGHIFLNVSNL